MTAQLALTALEQEIIDALYVRPRTLADLECVLRNYLRFSEVTAALRGLQQRGLVLLLRHRGQHSYALAPGAMQ